MLQQSVTGRRGGGVSEGGEMFDGRWRTSGTGGLESTSAARYSTAEEAHSLHGGHDAAVPVPVPVPALALAQATVAVAFTVTFTVTAASTATATATAAAAA